MTGWIAAIGTCSSYANDIILVARSLTCEIALAASAMINFYDRVHCVFVVNVVNFVRDVHITCARCSHWMGPFIRNLFRLPEARAMRDAGLLSLNCRISVDWFDHFVVKFFNFMLDIGARRGRSQYTQPTLRIMMGTRKIHNLCNIRHKSMFYYNFFLWLFCGQLGPIFPFSWAPVKKGGKKGGGTCSKILTRRDINIHDCETHLH